MNDFRKRLESDGPVLLDGPMGTELNRLGVDTGLPLWSARGLLDAPDIVRAVHESYIRAGAEVLTTNTFRTHERSLAKAGLRARAGELTDLAVGLARAAIVGVAAEHRVWVAGSVAPLEDCFAPQLTHDDDVLRREHEGHVDRLASAGVDVLLVETMPTVREAAAAARAALRTGRPVLVGLTCDTRGRILSGESLAHAVEVLQPLGVDALMINCTPAHAMTAALRELGRNTALPIGAYGNVGHAEDESGWTSTAALDARQYARHAAQWIDLGARLIGSCCGTDVATVAALARLLGRPAA